MTTKDNGYIGDDLPNLIKVDKPDNTDHLNIVKSVVRIGEITDIKDNPVFPYFITVRRKDCLKLNSENPVYMAIYYKEGSQTIRCTCEGAFELSLNAQVVQNVEDNNG